MRRLLPLVVILAAAGAARAQDPAAEARALAERATAAAAKGDLAGAAALFKEAHALDPLPEYQCNVGVAFWKQRDLPRAQLFLSICLARGSHLPAAFTDGVRDVLAKVEELLRAGEFMPLDVVVSPAGAEVWVSAFSEDEAFIGSRVVWVPFGEHRLVVRAERYTPLEHVVTADTRDTVTFRATLVEAPPPDAPDEPPVDVPPDEPADAPDTGGPDAGAPEPPPADVGAGPPAPRSPPSRVPPLIVTGGAAASGIVTAILYTRARDAADEAATLELDEGYAAAADRARRLRTLTYAGYVVTAGAAAAAAYLWWRALGDDPPATVEVRGDGATVWVGGAF